MPRNPHCIDCKKEIIPPDPKVSCCTGYGCIGNNRKRKICYDCCGKRDYVEMIKTGKATLYLSFNETSETWQATNWPGTLKFNIGPRKLGKHNIGGTRVDVWFLGQTLRLGTEYSTATTLRFYIAQGLNR